VSINANIGISSDLGDLGSGRVKIFPVSRFGGVGGLIVYRDFDDIYHVYDAACTHDYFDDCFVEESPSFGELMVCPCCSSSYLMSSDGGVFEGPAVHPLIPYDSFIDGGFLRVVN
jgi:nitrite reductase/ring-hydroxylating ferredoxin subunit